MTYFARQFHDSASDLRKVRRVDARELFRVEFKKGKIFPRRGRGDGWDLSVQGIRFATAQSLQKGDRLRLTVFFSPDFPGESKIEAEAWVVYVKRLGRRGPCEVGCQLFYEEGAIEETLPQFLYWIELRPEAVPAQT